MKKTQLSTSLFQQVGGTTYVSRPAYFQRNDFASLASTETPNVEVVVETKGFELAAAEVLSEPTMITSISDEGANSTGLSLDKIGFVLLGSGLNSIWEDETKSEWLLLQNICQAFGLSEEQLSYFDTDSLISEEAIFTTMEEIIDLGVEWVFSMESEHAISEQLSEGVQVIHIPSLEQMLFDPYAKQSFYQSALPLLSPA